MKLWNIPPRYVADASSRKQKKVGNPDNQVAQVEFTLKIIGLDFDCLIFQDCPYVSISKQILRGVM